MTTAPPDPFLDPCHDLVGGAPAMMGPWQLDLLVRRGLTVDATLLDLGCGTLRGGLHFIRFLGDGRYFGADVDRELLAMGAVLVSRAGLDHKAPSLMTIDALDARRAQYDWVLTQSVLNHLDAEDTIATVRRVARALAPGGRWVSTVRFDHTVERVRPGKAHGRRPDEYWRSLTNPEWLQGVLAACGLHFDLIRDAAHPRGMDVFEAARLVRDPQGGA